MAGRIKIAQNGPYMVTGGVPLHKLEMVTKGHHREYVDKGKVDGAEGAYCLCRCGQSSNLPFCDGTHEQVQFDGTEVATKKPFEERVEVFPGGTLDLSDDGRCAFARFCHREDGDVWTLTEKSSDPHMRAEAIQSANDCPAGRLVQHDKEKGGEVIEPELEPRLSLLEDPDRDCSGPIFAQGGIELEGKDGIYEVRNRYTLCRCGSSDNKPFCDAMHVQIGFKDKL